MLPRDLQEEEEEGYHGLAQADLHDEANFDSDSNFLEWWGCSCFGGSSGTKLSDSPDQNMKKSLRCRGEKRSTDSLLGSGKCILRKRQKTACFSGCLLEL